MSTESAGGTVTEVAPEMLERWMREGGAVLVDVREDFEHAEERIEGAELVPLSKFDAEGVRARYPGRRVVFHCRSGRRSAEAAGKFRVSNEEVFHLTGGIEGWKASGRATIRMAKGSRLPVMRQVQITAGFLVAAGVALGVFVNPWLLVIPAFVGCGLMFAGATGWCGMAMLLGRMPWNRSGGASCAS